MKQTSHTTKTHLHRKGFPGLTPDLILKQMQEKASAPRKSEVRKLRRAPVRQDSEVLPGSREGVPGPVGRGGIFGTDEGDKPQEVSDSSRTTESAAIQLSRVLKRMLGETPPSDLVNVEGIGRAATNAEMLGAIIMRAALDGKQWAVEMVRDQTEGKPVRAAQVNNTEAEIEDQLDRASAATLNRFVKKGE